MQALDRTQPGLPLKKGRAQTMTHDYKRHGTTTLFAALNVLEGQVIGQCQQRHTHVEWLKFLRKIDRETPKDKALHLIADNYATHKHPAIQDWLAKQTSALQQALHADISLLAEHGGAILPRHHGQPTASRCVHQRA